MTGTATLQQRAALVARRAVGNDGFLQAPEGRVELTELRSVLARPGPPPRRLEAVDEGDRDYVAAEIAATMLGLLAGLGCLVVNRPAPGGVGRQVVRGAGRLPACGLGLAPTLVSWEPDDTLRFYRDACRERALVGPASGRALPALIEGEQGAEQLAPLTASRSSCKRCPRASGRA
jgi:hypothetical protein